MIYKGSVRMMTENGVQFTIYKRGEIIGDSEALFESLRDSKAVAAESCILYILKIEDCKEIFRLYPQAYIKMKQDALKKKQQHTDRMEEAMRKRPMFWTQGGLKEDVAKKLTKLGINQATLMKSQGQQQNVSLHLNEQEFGIIVEETNELLDLDNLMLEKLEKMKVVSEK